MREILFRGKDSSGVINHDWNFGSLDTTIKDFSVIIFYDRFGNKCRINVDSNTVGQYTGLVDKNGKRIFEGDIIKADNGHIGFVTFYNGSFVKCCFCHVGSINDIYGDNETIIGNKYDNPELLESDEYGKCTHPHSMYCQHCELWAPNWHKDMRKEDEGK